MADDKTTKPHTVPAGVMDRFLGNAGKNGELLDRGEPAMVTDLPDDDDEDDN